MNEKNLRAVDLNLLVILDALLRERSITRAAHELAMTQPAVSHALQRLRGLFDDPLLQRQGRSMQLTARAESLAEALAQILADVRLLTTTTATAARAARRTLRLSMLDVAIASLLPTLLAEVAEHAPGLTLACLDWALADAEVERLRRGQVDLVLTSLAALPADLRRERLGTIRQVGVARRDHPLFAGEESDPFDYPFAIVSSTGAIKSELDGALAAQGRSRRVIASLPHYLCVPPILAGSDALAFVPESLATMQSVQDILQTFAAPAGLHPLVLDLIWHRRSESDPLHIWVRERLARLVREKLSTVPPIGRPVAGRADA
jgi:DNA-binding transcriptional LysR family regulator